MPILLKTIHTSYLVNPVLFRWGFAYTALHDEDAKDLKEATKLDENSNILVISTEGDTDPVRYREIVWDGLYGTTESLSE